ncbi:hypothetical protein ND486_27755 [Pseudonocardia sp. DR1-2]|uniref:PIN domain-containing protein n=1 Tax=Pseudonocardia sp. DR1-2 TaxID=2951168 RepID=UPI0020431280|nr:PIN domain-containing protein [Pseudonocardia sp. DR1-2]MCM3849991.1 hypothetical protein [Pseudonocardia sp. DR1-2]
MTSEVPATAVVIDTDAFSHLFVLNRASRELSDRLVGRVPIIATQTRAELLAWPGLRSWGEARTERLHRILRSTLTVPVTDDVVNAYVELRVECTSRGHALGQKVHGADRWVAATAVALARPLIALDGIYAGAPRLSLL